MDQIEWYEVNGNPYRVALSPLMLLEGGCTTVMEVKHKNEPRRNPSLPKLVHYGEDYVIEWIVRKLLVPMAFKDYNSFQRLISKCWKRYQELKNSQ